MDVPRNYSMNDCIEHHMLKVNRQMLAKNQCETIPTHVQRNGLAVFISLLSQVQVSLAPR